MPAKIKIVGKDPKSKFKAAAKKFKGLKAAEFRQKMSEELRIDGPLTKRQHEARLAAAKAKSKRAGMTNEQKAMIRDARKLREYSKHKQIGAGESQLFEKAHQIITNMTGKRKARKGTVSDGTILDRGGHRVLAKGEVVGGGRPKAAPKQRIKKVPKAASRGLTPAGYAVPAGY
jgi:hypothetical protein